MNIIGFIFGCILGIILYKMYKYIFKEDGK